MSTITPGFYRPCKEVRTWMFAWTVERPPACRERRSNPFSFKGHEVHLVFHTDIWARRYSVYLCVPPLFPTLSTSDLTIRVETKNKTPLPLPNQRGIEPNDKVFWKYSDHEILEVYPDFYKDGKILTFIVCDVDPPKENPIHFDDVSSLESLSEDLSLLLQYRDSPPDMVLLCGEDHFKAHRNIVSARSKVISAMLKSDMSEARTGRIEIKDLDSEIFHHFVRFLYTGKLPDLNADTARGLYEAGDQYEVASLMKRCASFLVENLTPGNVCETLVLVDAHSDQTVKEIVMDYIVQNKIPLQEDNWLPFHDNCPKLSSEVLHRFRKQLNK